MTFFMGTCNLSLEESPHNGIQQTDSQHVPTTRVKHLHTPILIYLLDFMSPAAHYTLQPYFFCEVMMFMSFV